MKHTKRYNTLFVDRDGVINVHRPGDYVKSVDEFVFTEEALSALELLSRLFDRIIVVTNQRGVGRGIMSREDLEKIHAYMTNTISAHNGRIDAIYACTDTDNTSPDRKPNTGMALQAKRDFPDIDFARSFMVGDSISDMEFANNAGIPAILIGGKNSPGQIETVSIQAHYPNLIAFARYINRGG